MYILGGIGLLWFVITVDHHQMLNNVPCVYNAQQHVPHSPFYWACRDHLRFFIFFLYFSCFVFWKDCQGFQNNAREPFSFSFEYTSLLGCTYFLFFFVKAVLCIALTTITWQPCHCQNSSGKPNDVSNTGTWSPCFITRPSLKEATIEMCDNQHLPKNLN